MGFFIMQEKMNKQECKKYLKRAYKKLIENKENMNVKNIENNMKLVLEQQASEYIAYSKIAVNNMLNSGNIEITLEDLLAQIDVLPKVYTKCDAIKASNNL